MSRSICLLGATRSSAPCIAAISRTCRFALARALAYCGDVANAVGLGDFPFNSFRLNNVLTQYRFDLTPTEAVCGPLPYDMEQGVAETAKWLRGISAS